MSAANHNRSSLVYGLSVQGLGLLLCLGVLSACHRKPPLGPSAGELAWQQAHAIEKVGRFEEAARAYGALCAADPPLVRACQDELMVWFEAGDTKKARELAANFVRQHPEDAGVPSVARRLAHNFEESGDVEAGARELNTLADAVKGSEAQDTLLWELAGLWRRAQQPQEEKAALEQLVTAHGRWSSQLWDNALWRLAQLAGAAGDLRAEEAWLERLLESRQKSRIVGSYVSPLVDDALMRLAHIRQGRGDVKAAQKTLDELLDMETSLLADDALVLQATWLHQAGQKRQACQKINVVIDTMPDASERSKALSIREAWRCDSR